MHNQAPVRTVLIVEDEFVVREVACDFLQCLGFQTIEAASADEGLQILKAHANITIVFTDIQTPGCIDGVDLTAIICHRWPQIKIVVASGGSKELAGQLPSHVTFFAKPYDLNGVGEVLSRD